MQRVKIFKGVESGVEELEQQINSWIEQASAHVIHIFGNIAPQSSGGQSTGAVATSRGFAPSDVLIVMLYEPA